MTVMPVLDTGGAAKRFRGQGPWNGCGGIHAVRLVMSASVSHRLALYALDQRQWDAVDGRIKSGHDMLLYSMNAQSERRKDPAGQPWIKSGHDDWSDA